MVYLIFKLFKLLMMDLYLCKIPVVYFQKPKTDGVTMEGC